MMFVLHLANRALAVRSRLAFLDGFVAGAFQLSGKLAFAFRRRVGDHSPGGRRWGS